MLNPHHQMHNSTSLKKTEVLEKDIGPLDGAKYSLEYLEKVFEENKFDMNVCLKLIELNKNNRERLAFYREHVATYCPTNEEFWRTWIEEEQKEILKSELAVNADDLTAAERNVISLYRRGLNIMPTVDLWVDYLRFLHNLCVTHTSRFPPASGVSRIRRACEFALHDLGFHSIEGPRLWEFYRKFELMLLNSLFDNQSLQESDSTKVPVLHQQVKRVRNLFKRQLVLPLAGKQDLLDEYRILEAELPDYLKASREESAVVDELYSIGSSEWERRRELEREVVFLDDSHVEDINKLSESWNTFIEFEKNHPGKEKYFRVSAVYYRACEDLGHMRSDLWQAWAKWILCETKDYSKAAAILNRAVRFHPGNARLWSMLISCHIHNSPKQLERLKQIFTRAFLGLNSTGESHNPYDIAMFCIVTINSCFYSMYTERNLYRLKSGNIAQEQSDSSSHSSTASMDENLLQDKLLHPSMYQMKPYSGSFLNSFVREVFTFCEKFLLKRVSDFNNNKDVIEDRQINDSNVTTKVPVYNHAQTFLVAAGNDNSLIMSLHQIWFYWIYVEAKMFNNFSNALKIAQVVLKFSIDVQAFSSVNKHWSFIINLLSGVISKPHQVTLLRNFIEEVRSLLGNLESRAFLTSYLDFEKCHGDLAKVSALEKVLSASVIEPIKTEQNKEDSFKQSIDNQFVFPMSLAGLIYDEAYVGQSAFDYESSDNFFSTNSKLVRTTLEQLRDRRQKRRRRMSESESDTTYSDASSDSGSVASKCRLGASTELLNSNRKRHRCDEMKSYNSSSNYSVSQLLFQTSLRQEEKKIFEKKSMIGKELKDISKSVTLSSAEIQEIEKLTRSTWDGHECIDPATAPAVAPITSCMSPVFRRSRSSSESSSSSTVLQETPSCDVVYPFSQNNAPVYFDVGSHTASVPMEPKRKKRKQLQVEGHNLDETIVQEETNQTEQDTRFKVKPRKGAHYLQQLHPVSSQSKMDLLGKLDEKCTVYVSNLDSSVEEADIEKLFEDCQGLKAIRLIRDRRSHLKGFCYVDFETPELAADAVTRKTNSKIHKRKITIAVSEPKADIYEKTTLFVSNLPADTLKLCDDARLLIASVIENAVARNMNCTISVRCVRLITDSNTDMPKGYGYVDFFNIEDTQKALRIPCEELKLPNTGELFMLSPSVPMKEHRKNLASKVPKSTKKHNENISNSNVLFVKNLNFSTTEKKLEKHFDSEKTVNDVYICRDNDGKSKGFGFVEFKSERDAFSGLMLNDSILDGREITVCASRRVPTKPRSQHKTELLRSKMVDKADKPRKRLNI